MLGGASRQQDPLVELTGIRLTHFSLELQYLNVLFSGVADSKDAMPYLFVNPDACVVQKLNAQSLCSVWENTDFQNDDMIKDPRILSLRKLH